MERQHCRMQRQVLLVSQWLAQEIVEKSIGHLYGMSDGCQSTVPCFKWKKSAATRVFSVGFRFTTNSPHAFFSVCNSHLANSNIIIKFGENPATRKADH